MPCAPLNIITIKSANNNHNTWHKKVIKETYLYLLLESKATECDGNF